MNPKVYLFLRLLFWTLSGLAAVTLAFLGLRWLMGLFGLLPEAMVFRRQLPMLGVLLCINCINPLLSRKTLAVMTEQAHEQSVAAYLLRFSLGWGIIVGLSSLFYFGFYDELERATFTTVLFALAGLAGGLVYGAGTRKAYLNVRS